MRSIFVIILGLAATSCTITYSYNTEELNNLSKPVVVIAKPETDTRDSNPCMIVVDGEGNYKPLPLSNPVNKALYDTYGVGDTIGKPNRPKLYRVGRKPIFPSEYIISPK